MLPVIVTFSSSPPSNEYFDNEDDDEVAEGCDWIEGDGGTELFTVLKWELDEVSEDGTLRTLVMALQEDKRAS